MVRACILGLLACASAACATSREGGIEGFVVLRSDRQVSEAVSSEADLEDVRLIGPQVTNRSLRNLGEVQEMQRLWLTDTSINDAGLTHLGGHTNLRLLDLEGEDIGDQGVRKLGEMPRLEALILSNTEVTNEVVDLLSRFPSLSLMMIDETSVDPQVLLEAFAEKDGWRPRRTPGRGREDGDGPSPGFQPGGLPEPVH